MQTLHSIVKKTWPLIVAALAFPAYADIVTIRVNTSTGSLCIATPSGVISSKYCEDGDDGSAQVPPTAPSLSPSVAVTDVSALIARDAVCSGGTPPYTYQLESSTQGASAGFTEFDSDATFDADGFYLMEGLADDTQHWIRLFCTDAQPLKSVASAVQTFTTEVTPTPGDVTAPNKPATPVCVTDVALQATCSGFDSVDAVGVVAYNALIGLGDGAGNAVSGVSLVGTIVGAPPATTYTFVNLTEGQEYFARFEALDAAQNISARSDRVFFTPVGEPDPPPQGTTDTPDYPDPVAGVTLLGGRTTENATNNAGLTAALSPDPPCGTTIQLSATTYTGTFTVNSSCAANNPVIIKGAANFASVFNGGFTLNGARNIVTGIDFSGDNVSVVLNGNNNKLIGNKLHGWGDTADCNQIAVVFGLGPSAHHGEAAYNEVYSPGPWATGCTGTQNRAGFRTTEDGSSDFHYSGWVHHNYVHDFPQKPEPLNYDSGQTDWLEVGQTQSGTMPSINSGWYVESNYILRHLQGHGCFDAKVGGVVLRRNTMEDSKSTFNGSGLNCRMDHRTGSTNRSIFEANWLEDSGGMTIRGTNSLYGNRLVNSNTGYKIAAGNQACTNVSTGGGTNQACNVIMEGNIGNVQVGDSAGTTACAFPANNTIVRNHTGTVSLIGPKGGNPCQTNTTNTPTAAPTRDFEDAVKLGPTDVGPSALSSAPAAYRNARCPSGSC